MYDDKKAEEYWSKRVENADQLAAVLSFSLPSYINEAYSKWEVSCVLESLVEWKDKKVLDLGCGVGRVTVPLARKGAQVTALDNSQKMLDLCLENIRTACYTSQVELRQASARDLPFSDQTFDAVFCLGLLEHLPSQTREEALVEMIRVVRCDGTIVVVVNNTESAFLKREGRYTMEQQDKNGYYVSLVGRQTVERFFETNGFVVENVGSNLFQSFAKHLLKGFLPIGGSSTLLHTLLDLCTNLDLQFKHKGDLDEVFADQYILKATRVPTQARDIG
jgi:ubiquinone/menaquinone biosynthesis C-methylase UbiE